MNTQISDKYHAGNKVYAVIACSDPLPFDPDALGFAPDHAPDRCGYWCEYTCRDDRLILENLFIRCPDGHYPILFGVRPDPGLQLGHRVYRGLMLPVDYTGMLLLGMHRSRSLLAEDGHNPPWSYRQLKELVFENGILADTRDHSKTSAAIRRLILRRARPAGSAEALLSVREPFPWWLEKYRCDPL